MNIFDLVITAGNKIKAMDINNPQSMDIQFNHQSDTVTGMLTAIGIFPTARAMLNGHLHKLFAASIVMAYQANESIDIPTRKLSNFHDQGMSTQFLKWLDHCVKENLLISHSNKAEGRLTIGELIKRTLVS
tara:strand:- start:304 stop:696 length:393 start_codon:yes stop_codon:yes gene_type:complete